MTRKDYPFDPFDGLPGAVYMVSRVVSTKEWEAVKRWPKKAGRISICFDNNGNVIEDENLEAATTLTVSVNEDKFRIEIPKDYWGDEESMKELKG